MESKNTLVEARGLTKRYGEKVVVSGVAFHVDERECFGFLGPNGAGKSTIMRMIYCSSSVSEGELFVLNLSVKRSSSEIKARIGVIPQSDGLDSDFSVLENLLVYANYFRIPPKRASEKARELLRFMQLEDCDDQRVETLSGGMKRRLAIARSLINDPAVIVLDEPTTGLDPQSRIWIWERLLELKSKGTSLILTTHDMDEAEKMCDRIAIVDCGKVIAEGRPSDLISQHVGAEVVEFSCSTDDVNYLTTRIQDKYDYQILWGRMKLFIKENQNGKEAMNTISSDSMSIRRATLEDVFLKLTGHNLRE